MNESKLDDIENTTYDIRHTHEELMNYLMFNYDNAYKLTQQGGLVLYEFSGLTSFKFNYNVTIEVPSLLLTPPEFDDDMYPLMENESNFKEERPFNYLCNFDWYEFQNREVNKIYSAAIPDLINMSSQTRFSNIWVNVAAVFMYFRTYKCGQHLERLMQTLLAYWDNFPFLDKWDGFTDVKPKCSTMWPLLLYSYLSCCFDFICENITEVEACLCFQNHLLDAQIGYQDTKLAKKSFYLMWMKSACDKLNEVVVPTFSVTNNILGCHRRSTREIFSNDETKSKSIQMKSNLNDIFYNYLAQMLQKITSVEDIIKLQTVCLCARDDRTYYGTLMELAMSKAIKPKVVGSIVPAVIANKWIDSDPNRILDGQYPEHCFMRDIQLFLERYYVDLKRNMNNQDASSAFLNFLSTSSAGKKVEVPLSNRLSNINPRFKTLLTKGSNKRVIQEALMTPEYYSLKPIIEDFSKQIKIVIRKQIERRQRGIAGLSNNRLKINHPVYEANKAFSILADPPSHGKQTGTASDLHDLLYYTTMGDVCISSIDVVGMDTSIQVNVALHQSIAAIKILEGVRYDIGPFRESIVPVRYRDGDLKFERLSGAQQAIAYGISQFSQVTSFDSKYFGPIDNREGTFPSGLLTTSNHHTELLTLAIESLKVTYNNDMKKKISLMYSQVLGDDIVLYLSGESEEIDSFITYAKTRFEEIGLELERDESRNFGTFLQQQVILGRFSGFANRIGIFTREDYKIRKSIRESMSEMNALFDDIISRTYNVDNLVRFQRIFAFVTLSKYVLLVKDKIYDRLHSLLTSKLKVFNYEKHAVGLNDTRFIGFQIPYTYFQCYGGGEIPGDSYQRRDGSYTYECSIYTPKGNYLRRLLYDISGSDKLDQEWLARYKFHIAYFLIDSKWLDLLRTIRGDIIDDAMISELSFNLESLEGTNLRHKSREAYSTLKQFNVNLPLNGVYGYQIGERIKTVLMDIGESDFELRIVGDKMLESAEKSFKTLSVAIVPGDNNHIFTLKPNPDMPLTFGKKAHALRHIALAKNMQPFSDAWMLYVNMADEHSLESDFATAIGHSEGHFKNFKYDRDVFLSSLEIAGKYGLNSGLMELFFTAVNVNDATQILWKRAIEYYKQHKEYIYPYSINPRRMFFLPTQPTCIRPLLNELLLPDTVHQSALVYRQAYAYLVSHPRLVCGSSFNFIHGQLV